MAQRERCTTCTRLFLQEDLTTCEICQQESTYYGEVYNPETDSRRFNLSFYDPTVLQEKSHCANCLVDCLFCEYSICPSHQHFVELPWFGFPLTICTECNDFNKKSIHFSQVLSGKVLSDANTPIPDTVFDEVDRIVSGNEAFNHRTPDEVNEMTDEERVHYFQVKYLLYERRNE